MSILLFVLSAGFCFLYHGASGVGTDEESVFVMEGDSVTLNTSVKTSQQEDIKWYFYTIRLAQISKICTDVQCKERFGDRLKLDHQTGSLTITNTRNTDSGLYKLWINSSSNSSPKIFNVTVTARVSGVDKETVSVSVKEGDSVTLNTDFKTNQQDTIIWYFNRTRIAQINGDPSFICTDVQCNEGTERFRDRLKLDHQTGSLTIMNTRITDSEEYELVLMSNSDSPKIFNVTVSAVPGSCQSPAVPDPGLSSGAVAGIVVVLVFAAAVTAGVICYRKRQAGQKETQNNPDQENHLDDSTPDQTVPLMKNAANETSPNQTDAPKKDTSNGTSPSENKIPLMDTDNGTSSNSPEAAEEAL
ncbi:carcinoembryonic antigen-related cell adhesion molecule 1-like isoform X1 [Chanodichthys erythropterus]|uniref:carcinoembryonic antigen-related cell adhesion molecule 1-like isoform X1 n=1 Tax=Chanodichthys erythropterus TaxID=933992 RepID=UPI00351EC395